MFPIAVCIACGKRAAPKPPLIFVPERVSTLAAKRLGDEVVITFTIPIANAQGQGPADIEHVDVYAYTGTAAGDETIDIAKEGTLVGSIKVRKPPQPQEQDRRARRQNEKSNEPAPPPPEPEPKPPGTYDLGETVTITEKLTPALMTPDKAAVEAHDRLHRQSGPAPFRGLNYPGALEYPRRYYAAVAVSHKGKKSGISQRIAVPQLTPVSPPAIKDFLYTAASITVLLTPPPDAPCPIKGCPPPVVETPPAPAPATPETPAAPPPPPPIEPLAARSIVPSRLPVAYNLYDGKPVPPKEPLPAGAFYDQSKPINQAPLSDPIFVDARPVEFGVERCYIARSVTSVGNDQTRLSVESGPSEMTCFTPLDIFPPAAPRNLAAVGGEGVISLIWEPNTEPDLAGYIVLRGEAPGATLAPLTPTPIPETTYRDTTVKPGVRYVYVVQAVDNAEKPNVSPPSNRVEESAR